MNALKLVGLVLVAGWAAGTIGGMVGARQGKQAVEAAKAKGEAK
jgi:hypothetical protein